MSTAAGVTPSALPDPGETITCTFTNTENAKLITKKVVVSSTHPNQTFSFAGTAITGGPVSLGNNDTNQKTITDFKIRRASGTEGTTDPDWTTTITCTGDQGQSNLSTHTADTATFKPDPGETI